MRISDWSSDVCSSDLDYEKGDDDPVEQGGREVAPQPLTRASLGRDPPCTLFLHRSTPRTLTPCQRPAWALSSSGVVLSFDGCASDSAIWPLSPIGCGKQILALVPTPRCLRNFSSPRCNSTSAFVRGRPSQVPSRRRAREVSTAVTG